MTGYRTIGIEHLKNGWNSEEWSIYVDNKFYSHLPVEKYVNINLDYNAHNILIAIESTQHSNKKFRYLKEIAIRGDKNNHHYYVLFKQGLLENEIDVTEDVDVLKQNRKRELDQKMRDEAGRLFVSVIKEIEREEEINKRDYKKLTEGIPQGLRSHRVFKGLLKEYCSQQMALAVKSYPDKKKVFDYIEGLEKIPECANAMKSLLKYKNRLGNDLYRSCSIFNYDEDISLQVEKIKYKWDKWFSENNIGDGIQGVYKTISAFLVTYSDQQCEINGKINTQQYFQALKLITYADKGEEEVDTIVSILPQLLIYVAVSNLTDRQYNVNNMLKTFYNVYVATYREDYNGESLFFPTVDLLIADIYIYNTGNYIENITPDLEKFLQGMQLLSEEYTYQVDMEYFTHQFEILRKVLEELKAYNLEKLLLEGMYRYNIPRSKEQEQRLAFLKRGKSNAPQILDADMTGDVLYFDYRTINWKSDTFEKYVENMTMQSKLVNIPMVIEEWNKSISGINLKWDIDEITKLLNECMIENFGNRYNVLKRDSGALTEAGCELYPSILIEEHEELKYPYIAYLVTGEKMTAHRINLAIYALILPEFCANVNLSIVECNHKLLEKCKVVSEKQNPRLNNTIEMMKTVIIDKLEKWFLDNYSEDSIYN